MDAFFIGEVLGFLLIFIWLPWVCFSTAYFCTGAALAPINSILDYLLARLKNRKATGKQDIRPKQDPIPAPSKSPKKTKGSYPVIDSFDDAHRIVNPVEFDA